MVRYQLWSRGDFKNVIRREVMDTSSRWFTDTELNQYLDNWLQDLQQEYEFVWAINTITVGTVSTGSSLIFGTGTFTPGMLRNEAVYYNGFRLAGRLLQDLEVGDPIWRSDLGIGTSAGTNTWDTPRLAVMYPDYGNILIWPTPFPANFGGGTNSNVFVFEYPCLLSFATDTSTNPLPVWTQWSAKSYVCAKLFKRLGPLNDLKKSQRYSAQYQRAKLRIHRMWTNFLPERYRRIVPAINPNMAHYEYEIQLPPPAWDAGTNTATGT